MIWCTVLNPALDIIYNVSKFQAGSTLLDIPLSQVPAGKGINVARVVAALGEEVTVTGLLPELDEKRVRSFLDASAISGNFLSVPGAMRINTTVLDDETGATTHLSALSMRYSTRIQHEFLLFAGEKMRSGDLWSLSGSIPDGFDDDAYAGLIAACSAAKVPAMLDTRGPALNYGVRARPLMIKPNLAELEEFFGEPIQGVHHIALKGKRLLDMGVSYVFISLGSDGMIALHKNDCLLCSAPQVQVRDTVGCGDAMVAGILVASKRQFSFSETCRMAVACGSAKCLCKGPGVVTREAVWQLMEDVQITSI